MGQILQGISGHGGGGQHGAVGGGHYPLDKVTKAQKWMVISKKQAISFSPQEVVEPACLSLVMYMLVQAGWWKQGHTSQPTVCANQKWSLYAN